MKTIAFIITMACTACTNSQFERGGWIPPSPQQSQSMKVGMGGFTGERGKNSMNLFLVVSVQLVPVKAKFLRIVFPDPHTKEPRETRIISLAGAKDYEATSDPMTGLKHYDAYPVVVQLSEDRSGTSVIEAFRQYVRFELPRSIQSQLGINQ